MFQCDYCKIVSPSEDLAISHIRNNHQNEIINNKSWCECEWCFLYFPIGKKHMCLQDNQCCPLCSEDLTSASNKKVLYNHYRTKHKENVRVSTTFLEYTHHISLYSILP